MRLGRCAGVPLIPPVLKIEGTFAGVDPVFVMVLTAAAAAVIVMTAIIARQLARLQPKALVPSKVERASGEFDAWTERPKAQADQDKEYYSLYGSIPGRPVGAVGARAPPAPPAPGSAFGAPVVVDMSGRAPPRDKGWAAVADDTDVLTAPPPLPPIHPPATANPAGPSDEVVAPTHGRRVRDTATGEIPSREEQPVSYERSSAQAGAVTQRAPPGDPFSPKAQSTPPPPLAPARPSPPPPDKLVAAKLAEALPEGTAVGAPSRTAFRGPSRGQTVVGAGTAGTQEGTMLGPGKKSIRCPKCQTVFAGPVARPATVKCPACGTSGTLK